MNGKDLNSHQISKMFTFRIKSIAKPLSYNIVLQYSANIVKFWYSGRMQELFTVLTSTVI